MEEPAGKWSDCLPTSASSLKPGVGPSSLSPLLLLGRSIIKEAVSSSGWRKGGADERAGGSRSWAGSFAYPSSTPSSRTVSTSPRRPGAPSPAPPASSCCTPRPGEPGGASQSSAGAEAWGRRGETPWLGGRGLEPNNYVPSQWREVRSPRPCLASSEAR